MKASAMQKIVTAIADKHRLDLDAYEAHLRLEMGSHEPLVIEKVGKKLVSVAHYYVQNGDLMADPDVVFYISPAGWFPFEITQHGTGYYRRYVQFADGQPVTVNLPGQASLAAFCDWWSRNIRDQGWLERGVKR